MLNFQDVLAACAVSLPRYTSYPTAPHFSTEGACTLSGKLIEECRASSDISIYAHIPFCDRLCWFCGCHTKHTLKYLPVRLYVDHLIEEIQLVARQAGKRARIRHLHLGGGSPSILKASDFSRLRSALEEIGSFDPASEISVEIDPSDRNPELLEGLQRFGVTRASIGVQDFAPEVQVAINRIQSVEDTKRTIELLRSIGVSSVNIDILYGLPLQSEERLLATVEKAIQLNPDRLALFGYAHVPWMKKHQIMIRNEDLATSSDRMLQAAAAARALVAAGYVRIGLDHFARPADSLAVASRAGKLRRNFQGYTTDTSGVLLGLGASAISRCEAGYIQSTVATAQYEKSVRQGFLPHARGLALTTDDRIRGWIIERLMCDLQFRRQELALAFPQDWEWYWEIARKAHNDLLPGLTVMTSESFAVAEEARNFVRLVAAKFDAYLGRTSARYSKAV